MLDPTNALRLATIPTSPTNSLLLNIAAAAAAAVPTLVTQGVAVPSSRNAALSVEVGAGAARVITLYGWYGYKQGAEGNPGWFKIGVIDVSEGGGQVDILAFTIAASTKILFQIPTAGVERIYVETPAVAAAIKVWVQA